MDMSALRIRAERCLAFVLALMLALTNINMTVAARPMSAQGTSLSAGAVVANHYELSGEEEALLNSGLLAGGSFAYTAPSDSSLISVNADTRTITARSYTDPSGNVWKAASASVIVNGSVYETVSLNNGSGSYSYTGKAFSVQAVYELHVTVDVDTQTTLINTPYWLQQGVDNLDTVNAASSSLAALEYGMPELYDLAVNGYKIGSMTAGFSSDGKAAVFALKSQMDSNGGQLKLSTMLSTYSESNKVEYLLKNGSALKAEMVSTMGYVNTINTALGTVRSVMGGLVSSGMVDKSLYDMVVTMNDMLNKLTAATDAAMAGDWTAAEKGTALVKTGITSAEYEQLDALEAALGSGLHTASDFALTNPLLGCSVTVQSNMSMKDVTVVVKLMVAEDQVGSTKLVSGGEDHTVVLTLDEGAAMSTVAAAVAANGIESAAKADWSSYVEGHFTSSVSVSPSVSALTTDITYTITYSPVEYTITYGDGFNGRASQKVPYGYQLLLEKNPDLTKVYDYLVNGTYYPQGSVYTVDGNVTLSRTSGKPYTNTDLFTVIAGNYANEKESAILTSGALLNNPAIDLRYPDSDSGELVTIAGDLITALPYDSDYQGLVWKPYCYVANDNTYYFNGSQEAVVTEVGYASIEVIYRLAFKHDSNTILKNLNLPATLVEEAETQLATLNKLSADSVYNNMGQLNKATMGVLRGVISVTDFNGNGSTDDDGEMQAYFEGIVTDMIKNCFDSDNNLKIYNMLTVYRSSEGGLAYYYANSEAFLREVELISGYLSDMLADEEKIAALRVMVSSAGYPQYADKISDLEGIMAEVRADLLPPNAAIDTDSKNLEKLVSALTMSGAAGTYTAAQVSGGLWLDSDPFLLAASNKAAVKITLVLGNQTRVVSATYDKGYTLTQSDINGLLTQVNAAINEVLGGKLNYYTNNYSDGAAVKALVGLRLTENQILAYGWVPNEYTVKVVDEDGRAVTTDQIVTADSLTISLPAATEAGVRYDYTIDGKTVSSARYTFTLEQLGRLFGTGKSYRIVQKTVNVAGENLETLVSNLNALVGANAFVLTKENGKYTKLTATMGVDGIMGMAMGMINSGYDYVGLNYESLISLDAGGSLEICLQSVVDAVLHDSSFTNQTLINIAAKRSGKLVTTTMQLGSAADAIEHDIAFELVLSSAPNRLVSLGNVLAGAKDQFSFRSNAGQLDMVLTLSEDEYTAYLGNLILTGNAELTDLNSVRMLSAYQYLEEYISAVLSESVTTTTLENTAASMGKTLNLAAKSEYFNHMKNILGGDKLVCTASGYKLNALISAETLDDVMASAISDPAMLSNIRSLVKECRTGSGLTVNAKLTVSNFTDSNNDGLLDADYEAVILDHGAAGMSAISFTGDLAAAAKKLSGTVIVVLQQDVKQNLSFSSNVVLNLNGHTVDGTVYAEGELLILDSTFGVDARGGVTKAVSARKGVLILSGTYGTNISGYLPGGATQDSASGAVMNQIYTLTEDAAGNITVNLKAGMLGLDVPADRSYVYIDLYMTFLFRNFSAALVKMDDDVLCRANLENLYTLKGDKNAVNTLLSMYGNEALSSWFTDLSNVLLDFGAVETAIRGGSPIYTAAMTTAPWHLTLTHDLQKDCLVMGAQASADTRSVSITVKVVGDQTDKNALAALNGGLAQTVDAQVTYQVTGMDVSSGFVAPDYSLNKVISVDLTKNSDYAAVAGVLLACSGVNKTELVSALNSYFNARGADALKAALEKITFDQLVNSFSSLKKDVDFKTMASAIGVNASTSAAELEGIYHEFLVGLAQTLKNSAALTDSQTLGSDGTFVIKKTVTPNAVSGSMILPGEEEAPYTIDLTIKVFGDCTHSYGKWTAVDAYHHKHTCSRCGVSDVASHSYDSTSDTTCNDCGYTRAEDDEDPETSDIGTAPSNGIRVNTAQQLASAIAAAGNGDVIVVSSNIRLDRDITVTKSITIFGAGLVNDTGYLFCLDNTGVTLTTDRVLNVSSGADGYFVTRNTKTGVYSLTEAPAPDTAAPVAGSKVEKLKSVRYLFLDLDPSNGMTLSALAQKMSYSAMKDCTLKLTVSGNSGSGLVKTSDRLTVTVWNEEGRQIAQVSYVVIVMGDTNCNGKVNTSDATVLKNINFGESYSFEIQLAADTNLSGTLEVPKINSSDVAYIMGKWFAWDNNKYASNLK